MIRFSKENHLCDDSKDFDWPKVCLAAGVEHFG